MAQTEAQLRANKKYREEKLESITVYPATEFVLSEEQIRKGISKLEKFKHTPPPTGSLPTHSSTARSMKPSTAKSSPIRSEPPHRAVFLPKKIGFCF